MLYSASVFKKGKPLIVVGIDPPMLFEAKLSDVAANKLPIDAGNVPDKPREGRERDTMYESPFTVSHVTPVQPSVQAFFVYAPFETVKS